MVEAQRNAGKDARDSSRPPWMKWKGTSAGRRIKFIEKYLRVPRGVNAGQLIKLEKFQRDFIADVYADGVLAAGFGLPRGNGKSGLLACVALAELFLNEWSPDVGIAAVTLTQSGRPSGVYGLARRMVTLEPELADRCTVYSNNADPRLVTAYNDGIMAPISSRDVDSLLGLSSSLLIADEFGAGHWDEARWGALVQSGGKRGTDSRVIGISTPGSKQSAMWTLRTKVMAGQASASMLWREFAADPDAPMGDRKQWAAANPALGKFLHISALEADFLDRPAWAFRMMRLGLWEDADEGGWLGPAGPDAWDACTEAVKLSPDLPTYVGVDKSAYDDCSAVATLQAQGDRWVCSVRVFHPDPVIDHAAVRDHIRAEVGRYKVLAVGYDDRYFVEGASDLEAEGLPMVKVPQTVQRMVPAYSALHRDIIARNLYHDDDPILRAHVLGAVPVIQSSGGFMLAKSKSRTKIDGVVALGIARSLTELEGPPADESFRIW